MENLASMNDFKPAARTEGAQAISRPSLSYWQDAWIRLKKNKQALVSLILIVLLVAFVLIGPLLWRINPADQDLARPNERPTLARTVLVAPELTPYEELYAQGVPETPEIAPEGDLPATESFTTLDEPSIEAIRLKWAAVPGAASYVIYRSDTAPTETDPGYLVAEVMGGNAISYQDQFNLKSGTYHYTLVAKYENESPNRASLKVEIPVSLSYSAAQRINADVQAGEKIELEARPFGTDSLGRDVLSRMMQGGAVSLGIGFFAPLMSTLIGMFIGGLAGFMGGKVDAWLMRFTDFVLALPFLLFVILFKIAFGAGPGESGIMAMTVALVALSWTSTARLTRGQVLQIRESEFVQAARLLGAKPWYLILRHLFPNTLGVILVSLTFEIPRAIFTEAFLSFIGMGVAPPEASWGSLCNEGTLTFLTHPYEFLFPALFISLTVLAFNLLGDGLRDALDPRMRSVS